MKRREFIRLLGGAASWPLAAGAQHVWMPVVGLISIRSPEDSAKLIATFRGGLKEFGFIEGQNVRLEHRWADRQYDRLPALALDLVERQAAVLVAIANPSALAVNATVKRLPIVFAIGGDPVQLGLVASLNRPGGNVTGVSFFASQLEAKRLELLHELVPRAKVVAVLLNPNNPTVDVQLREVQEAARSLGLTLRVLDASSEREIETAFTALVHLEAGGLLVAAASFFFSRRHQLATIAAVYAVPAIYEWRDFPEVGGLASYGTDLANAYRQVGMYTGRILNGERPADLPVMQSTKFEFVLNLRTAKALGLEVPPTLLARADEVIE
jgi:ABC-type uncharacterized transport system substrate-binding protein